MIRTTSGRLAIQGLSLLRASTGAKTITTNQRQQNTAPTAEPRTAGAADKFLHYSDQEGFTKSSPFEAVQPLNVPLDKYIWRDYQKWENNVATVCVVTGRQYTFAQLRDASAALAVRLQTKFRLGHRDVVAVCLPNLPEYPIAALGPIEAGLTVTTVNPIYTAEEISRQLTFSEAKFIIGTSAGFPVLQEACRLAQKHLPIACVRTSPADSLPAGAIDFAELIRSDGSVDFSQLKQHDFHGDDMVFLPFSSGTTGLPKGVRLSHNNITVNCEQIQTLIAIDSLAYQDTLPCVLPFFHIYGLTVVMLSKLGQGARLATLPQFKPEDLMKALYEYKGSILNFVPPIALFMTNHPKVTPETTPHLRLVMSGAAPIGVTDVERFLKKFPHTKFLQGYGMTEASPVILLTPPTNTRFGSVGFLAGGTEAKIVAFDSDAADATDAKSTETTPRGQGPNVTGELCVRGPQVMDGYLNNEEATRETFYPDGWLRTGDVAHYDDDGYFYITDRMKELIKVKGFQVPPAELEATLRDHPQVLEAAVFGVPHPLNGEAPRALVVLRPGAKVSEAEICDFVAQRVASYKRLEAGVLFVDEVPKNPTGKILRKGLREKYSS